MIKRIGANKQNQIDMRNARIDAVVDSKPFVYSVYTLVGCVVVTCGYVMCAVGQSIANGVM